MDSIDVLLIDGEILARRAIAQVLTHTSKFAINSISIDKAVEDLEKIVTDYNPNVILLSIEDERSDSTFRLIRNYFPNLPILLLSARTEEGAKAASTFFQNGAVDVITKPEPNTSLLFAYDHLEKRLAISIEAASKIENLDSVLIGRAESGQDARTSFEELSTGPNSLSVVDVIVIGGCMGGPHALLKIIPKLPPNLDVPVVVTQHFPKIYTRQLATLLNEKSQIQVREAYDGTKLSGDTVWIAPGGYHTEIVRESHTSSFLKVHCGARVNNSRPSIDLLFNSAANSYGNKVLGIILSGFGADGLEGCRRIKEAGGHVIVQDPGSSLAPDMPLLMIKEKLVSGYFTTDELASIISIKIHSTDENSIHQTSLENKIQNNT
ncbi:chemotaxis protein CheB [Halalkalibaculum sp. DA384]|uniref:chemotaxis protein CheB n=1 Tax=Halalkalibaculum sp. DA384 TaxID=3373606 RepID=UPI00375460AB